MGSSFPPKVLDAGTAPEFFCSGLGRVECLGANARFSLFVQQISPSGSPENLVNVRIVMPLDAVGPAVELTLQTLSSGLIVPVTKFITNRLFH